VVEGVVKLVEGGPQCRILADARPDLSRGCALYGHATSGFQWANIPEGLCLQTQACKV
jgi:hypothetical protein